MSKKPKSVKPDPYEGIDCPLLIKLYCEQLLAVDKLPYTIEIDNMVSVYNSHAKCPTTHLDCYRTLIRLRKDGKLIARSKRGKKTVEKVSRKKKEDTPRQPFPGQKEFDFN
jgi:hypothetical protein